MALARRPQVVFLSLVALSQAITVPVKKCCPEGQALVNGTNECKPHIGPTSFEAIKGLDLNQDIHSPHRIIPINVTISEFAKPKCRSHFETHLFRNKDVTRYGEYCVDLCDQHEGSEYFWCHTASSWDYCSLDHMHTIYNERCAANCAAAGTDYFWCYLELTQQQKETCVSGVDLWDYCSPVTQSHSWLTVNGSLVTSRYEAEFAHGDFCVDHAASDEGEVLALMCDPCTGGSRGKKHCLNLCCPHGHYETWGQCLPHNDTINWDPKFWSDEDTQHAMERNKDYVLAAPAKGGEGFVCPPSRWKSGPRERMAAEIDLGYNFTLELNGNLKAKYPPKNPNDQDSISGCKDPNTHEPSQICIFEPNEFCLYYGEELPDYSTDYSVEGPTNDTSKGTINDEGAIVDEADENGSPNYDEYPVNLDYPEYPEPSSENVFAYMYCSKDEFEEPDKSQKITRALYPWAVGISNFFLFLTIIAIILEPDLRKGLFGQITVGFVTNLLIGYIFIAYAHNTTLKPETRGCVATGYLTQYSFLAFFFWINAMALNIFLKFSMANKFQQNSSRNENKKFWWYFLYAQGLPLVICCITALVDHMGHKNACTLKPEGFFEIEDEKTLSLPNMGVFSCFLSTSHAGQQGSYFATPSFIYFQLFLIIIQILNITFFSVTVHHLTKHWKETRDLNKNSDGESSRENLYVVIKLFVIMGVTWVFEFITSWIEHNHGQSDWYSDSGGFVMRIILDIPNLFQGFLIFVVLVCKEKVLMNLKARVTGTSARRDTMASSTNKTMRTAAYSESATNQEAIPLKPYPNN